MSRRPPALSILILTEDSGTGSHETIVALVGAALRFIDPACDLDRVRFEPLDDERLRQLVRGNCWKSRQPEDRRHVRELLRRIASKLCEKQRPGFVVFHVDGDRRWAERAESENRSMFRAIVRNRVQRLLVEPRWGKRIGGARPAERMNRLLVCMPFYSVEAWAYQNIAEARRILIEEHGGAYTYQFDQWEQDRGALEEILRIKETIPPLRHRYNRRLVETAFPVEEAIAVGKSLHETVESMRRCSALLEALARTRAIPTPAAAD